MVNRRNFLSGLSGLPLVGGLFRAQAASSRSGRELFESLKVRPFINAAGTFTNMTATLMLPEVMDAINYVSKHYVMLDELHDAVGARLATLTGAEAAMVTAGAASALTLGTAGVLTGGNRKFIEQLPDLTGMKTDVIIQKSHRFGYDHAIRNCGVRLVEVETREQAERAISDKTALMFFLNHENNAGAIQDAEWVEIGKKHGIPTFNDCAAELPPFENLTKWIKMGFDLVCFSGGKGLRGPQSSGLLLGRKDLIAAARMNNSPNSSTIGRGMKVNKEEMVGLLAAVERFVSLDHAKQNQEWERWAKTVVDGAAAVPGVKAEVYLPEIANHWPHVRVSWDRAAIKPSPGEVVRMLRAGEPSIAVQTAGNALDIGVLTLRPGEDRIVARRLRQVLKEAAGAARSS